MFKPKALTIAIVSSALFLTACNSNDDDNVALPNATTTITVTPSLGKILNARVALKNATTGATIAATKTLTPSDNGTATFTVPIKQLAEPILAEVLPTTAGKVEYFDEALEQNKTITVAAADIAKPILRAAASVTANANIGVTGLTEAAVQQAEKQVEAAVARIFTYAAHADKYDGRVHHTPFRNVTLAMNEPIGVLGLVLPNAQPLLSFVSTVFPAIAMGNRVVVLPSQQHPLCATDFYQVLDTSDMPGGVVNIITGEHAELAPVLANHDDVDGIWHFGDSALTAAIEKASSETMKRIWSEAGHELDWMAPQPAALFLRKACEVKNIWVPYGE